jgi:probable F420-dependent oxidoreductase
MRLGVFGLNAAPAYRREDTLRLARLAEELGYDSVWAGEHVVVPSPRVRPSPMDPDDPILDPLIHLAFLAAATEQLLLATGIIILPQRNPLVLAKQAASLDVLSGGRLVLGIGAGYLEPELAALGVPLDERGARTDDYLAAMRAVWIGSGPVAYDGRFAHFSDVEAHPRPVQPGGPRIVVGGHTPPAFRRAVAHGHGWYGFALTPDTAAECVDGLRRATGEVDRPAELGELEITVTPRRWPDRETVDGFAAAGVHRLVPNVIGVPTLDAVAERLRAAAALAL